MKKKSIKDVGCLKKDDIVPCYECKRIFFKEDMQRIPIHSACGDTGTFRYLCPQHNVKYDWVTIFSGGWEWYYKVVEVDKNGKPN